MGLHLTSIYCWLVVDLPLWKIWLCQLGWWNSQYMEKQKNVPHHQPVYIYTRFEWNSDGVLVLILGCLDIKSARVFAICSIAWYKIWYIYIYIYLHQLDDVGIRCCKFVHTLWATSWWRFTWMFFHLDLNGLSTSTPTQDNLSVIWLQFLRQTLWLQKRCRPVHGSFHDICIARWSCHGYVIQSDM